MHYTPQSVGRTTDRHNQRGVSVFPLQRVRVRRFASGHVMGNRTRTHSSSRCFQRFFFCAGSPATAPPPPPPSFPGFAPAADPSEVRLLRPSSAIAVEVDAMILDGGAPAICSEPAPPPPPDAADDAFRLAAVGLRESLDCSARVSKLPLVTPWGRPGKRREAAQDTMRTES